MKTAMFFLITLFFGVSVINNPPNKKSVTVNAETQKPPEPRIDFILGSWPGTGFITDANGLEQYVEIKENNSSTSNIAYQIVGVCKNPKSVNHATYSQSCVTHPLSILPIFVL